ncbi:MAG TPA: IS1595 family transposase [Caulobacter sp.]|nr:IS1595 family transposase [Caulobacter sp.]
MSNLSAPHFHNEEAAYAYVEARVWPQGAVCPHCGGYERIGKMGGKSTRIGTYKCYQCRKPFTVKVGTIFEASHVPLRHWLQAMYLMAASKKGISANQIHRTLGCTLKTAWFLAHRIREAMRSGDLAPFGEGGPVEMDETYQGNIKEPKTVRSNGTPFLGSKRGRGPSNKRTIVALVERGGRVRSFHIERATKSSINEIILANVAREAVLYTDESRLYADAKDHVSEHASVRHSRGEYVVAAAHSNTIEGVFSIFKRGMRGVYQHCSEKHLHRYLAEFDFRYCNRVALGVNDIERTDKLLSGVVGRRLTYQTARGQA